MIKVVMTSSSCDPESWQIHSTTKQAELLADEWVGENG